MPTLSLKKIIDKITIKNGEENVSVIAVANCKLITEMNTKIFINKKQSPLRKLKYKNFLFKFLNTKKYSFVNKSNRNKGIIAAAFLNNAN